MPEITLDLIWEQNERILAGQVEIKQRLAALEKTVVEHKDENMVLTGLVLRYAGERIAQAGLQAEIKKIQARLEALEAER